MLKHIGILAGLFLACGWTGFGQAAESGVIFHHKDWMLACDNGLTCRAAGYSPEGTDNPAAILLTRRAGPHTAVTGELILYGDERYFPHGAVFRLFLNGRDLGVVPDDGPLTAAQVNALVRALPGRATIRIHSAQYEWQISDHGASAVFRKMDDVQARLQTPGALVVKGQQPESGVPAAPQLPVIHQGAVLDKRTHWVTQGDPLFHQYHDLLLALLKTHCDAEPLQTRHGQMGFEVARLTTQKSLLMSACWSAAYNFGSIGVVVNTKAPFAPEVIDTGLTDYSDANVSYMMKDRGLGDCWSGRDWTFDGQRFVLSGVYNTGMCRGIAGGLGAMPTYSVRTVMPASAQP